MYSLLTIRRVHRSATRQFHTLLSKEKIKPASPTPTSQQFYKLSLLDQFATAAYAPIIFFYPNHNSNILGAESVLKNSLSKTLAQYCPIAGTLTDQACIRCNDEGVEFSDVRFKCGLTEILKNNDYKALTPLSPVSLAAGDEKHSGTSPLIVQLNSFSCGGLALTVCISHRVADGCSMFNFINNWADVARESKEGPHGPSQFIGTLTSALGTDDTMPVPAIDFDGKNCVTRRFTFSDSRLAELKKIAAESGVESPTRVQVLSSLIYEKAVTAARVRSGAFKPSTLIQPVNLRDKIVPHLPDNSFGNFCLGNITMTAREDDLNMVNLAGQLRNGLMQYKGLEIPNVNEWLMAMRAPMLEGLKQLYGNGSNVTLYYCSSFVRYPAYSVDFGWGKPVKVTFGGLLPKNTFLLADTPNGDGIDALVTLKEEDMHFFEKDDELLAFGSPN